MNYRPLGRTGLEVSVLGFGTSPLGGSFRPADERQGIECVRVALELGINFIDTAPLYGLTSSETILGKALRDVPRASYVLCSKVGQYGNGQVDFSAEGVVRSVEASCARLGVDHLDVVLCHDVEDTTPAQLMAETFPALVRLREQGKVRFLGFSGHPLRIFSSLLEQVDPGMVDVILSHSHYTLNNSRLGELIPYLKAKRVGIVNAAPTGMGLLSPAGPPAWHPAPRELIDGCRKAVEFCRARGVDVLQLAIQFGLSDPAIATLVVGTANPANLRRNVAFAESPIDFEMMAAVLAVLKPVHNWGFGRDLDPPSLYGK